MRRGGPARGRRGRGPRAARAPASGIGPRRAGGPSRGAKPRMPPGAPRWRGALRPGDWGGSGPGSAASALTMARSAGLPVAGPAREERGGADARQARAGLILAPPGPRGGAAMRTRWEGAAGAGEGRSPPGRRAATPGGGAERPAREGRGLRGEPGDWGFARLVSALAPSSSPWCRM